MALLVVATFVATAAVGIDLHPGDLRAPGVGADDHLLWSAPSRGGDPLAAKAAGVSGPVAPTWVGWNRSPAPSPRVAFGMSFDPMTNTTILFGGFLPTPVANPENDTWSFNHSGWTNVTTIVTGAPPPLDGFSLAADPGDGYLVLFGGQLTGNVAVNQTWTFANDRWQHLVTTVAPSPRTGAGMAWDATIGKIVLYGGENATTGTYYNDTWTFSAGQWTLVPGARGPAGRDYAAFAYDASEGGVLMFGGRTSPTSVPFNDTELFSGGKWSSLGTRGGPVGRASAEMAEEGPSGPELLFGGFNGSTGNVYYNDTWEYSATGWRQLAPTESPIPRGTGGFVDDAADGVVVQFGGAGIYADLGDTWIFDTVAANVTASALSGTAPFSFSASAVPSGGWAPYFENWSLNGASPQNGTTYRHTFLTPGSFELNLSATDSLGAQSSTDSLHVTVLAAPPPPLVVTIVANRTTGPVPLSVGFGATVTGGVGTYTFSWTFGDGFGSASANPSHSFLEIGRWLVNLTVTDGRGDQASNSTAIVTSAPPVPTSAGCTAAIGSSCRLVGPLSLDDLLAVVAAAVIAGALVLLLLRRVRAAREPVPDGAEEGSVDSNGSADAMDGPGSELGVDPDAGEPLADVGSGNVVPGDASALSSPPVGPTSPAAASLPDQILVHLYRLGRPSGSEAYPPGFTQLGLAAALGRPQSAFARALQRLESAQLVRSQIAHVQGARRRLKVYELTPQGEWAARRLIPRP